MSFVPKTSQKKIIKRLKDRQYEDLDLVADLERNILKRRDHIVSPFKEGENVILLLSGGLDSVAVWVLLLKHYRVNVYPFHLNGSLKLGERLSLTYYQKILKQETNFRPIKHFYAGSKFFNFTKKPELLSAQTILEHYDHQVEEVLSPATGSNMFATLYGGYYSAQLAWNRSIKVNKIISAVTAHDGLAISTQTQTFARLINLVIMLIFNNNQLEYYHLGLEKELGLWLEKKDFIDLTSKLNFSLDKTHTCSNFPITHCGSCMSCRSRIAAFADTEIGDKTFYWKQLFAQIQTAMGSLAFWVKNIWKGLTPWVKDISMRVLYKLLGKKIMKKYVKPLIKKIKIKAISFADFH